MAKEAESYISGRFRYKGGRPDLWYPLSPGAERSKREFERKVAEGAYRFESVPCYCGGGESTKISEVDRYGIYYPLVVCRRCGLIRAEPRLTPDSYADFYDKHYRAIYGDEDIDEETNFARKVQEGEEVYRFIAGHVPLAPGSVVFDVGCFMGTMLLPFKRAGMEVYGVDYGSRDIEKGREKTGIDTLFVGGSERLLALGRRADLIILHHVLHHVPDIKGEMERLRRLLKPGGRLYIAVPGTYWWVRNVCFGNVMCLIQNAHTYQFGLETLRYVMGCGGFELEHGDEGIVAVFRVSDRFRAPDDVPAGEHDRAIAYLKREERRYTPRRLATGALEAAGIRRFLKRLFYGGGQAPGGPRQKV